MSEVLQAALDAPAILMTQRNLEPSLEWLRSIGVDAPDFPERCLFRRAGGVDYSVVSAGEMASELETEEAFGLMGADKFGELPPAKSLRFEAVRRLPCRFALFLPENATWDGRTAITVATSNPRALSEFALRRGIPVKEVVCKKGKIERYPASGQTDAGFDIVETEETLQANWQRIVAQDASIALGGVWRKRAV